MSNGDPIPLEYARAVLDDPSVEKLLEAFKDFANAGRRHGEAWTEIAIAKWMRDSATEQTHEAASFALRAAAEEIETKAWRRPEFFSGHDLEAEAGKIPPSKP